MAGAEILNDLCSVFRMRKDQIKNYLLYSHDFSLSNNINFITILYYTNKIVGYTLKAGCVPQGYRRVESSSAFKSLLTAKHLGSVKSIIGLARV